MELQRHAVDAMPLARRSWSIIENMAQVGPTDGAGDLRPRHERNGPVGMLVNVVANLVVEGGPAGATVELRFRAGRNEHCNVTPNWLGIDEKTNHKTKGGTSKKTN